MVLFENRFLPLLAASLGLVFIGSPALAKACPQVIVCGLKDGQPKEYPDRCIAEKDGATNISPKKGTSCGAAALNVGPSFAAALQRSQSLRSDLIKAIEKKPTTWANENKANALVAEAQKHLERAQKLLDQGKVLSAANEEAKATQLLAKAAGAK
ncbi:MAG: hypothetical protein JNM89_10995 [Hyphomicrobiaceae bacterium]|nr:hypothetical protein [Hyphomicrobiaceae bacterium]